jgi:hypothetical protein
MEMRDDDAFWAARRVAAFTDDLIRAAVGTGQFSNPAAVQHLVDVLIKRRNKIASIYLTDLNPIVNPRLDATNRLTFENAAFAAGAAESPATYRAAWSVFDNSTGETRPIGDTESTTMTIEAPPGVPTAGTFVAIDLTVDSAAHPSWRQPLRSYFRHTSGDWKLVGLERQAETLPAAGLSQKGPR